VIELKRRRKEKRARRIETRPEPTIYGNCDSWSFIVGKKPAPYSRKTSRQGSLQRGNKPFMHNLSTYLHGQLLDNLWVICGSSQAVMTPSRIVDFQLFYMPVFNDQKTPF
jgi:hypothetical protein